MINIILCGGSGTRLWPISRTMMPKQFVKMFGGESLFQLTVKRNSSLCSGLFIVSNFDQYFLALDQTDETWHRECGYLLEPVGRNTAPAIALACLAQDRDEILLVTPSDHMIRNTGAYAKAVERAKELADCGYIVTFGIKPEYPETGYGYIKADGENVLAFYEKPDHKKAQEFVSSGDFFWNSGIFCFKAGKYLEELEKYSPEIYKASCAAYDRARKNGIIRPQEEDMLAIPENSIDYAVMEKSSIVKMVPADLSWSDVGSFDALYDEMQKDSNGNTVSDKLISMDCHNNLFYGGGRTMAAIDVDDLIVIDTTDALLISKRGSSQKVKKLINEIKLKNIELTQTHVTVYRPWGTYTVLENNPHYKIKRIVVKPGKRLSLQKHLHRNEHWIVVSGTATVTVGSETTLLRANESTYIRMGQEHRLGNDGKIPVVLIEAQVGEYTGEDDIIRLNDDFKRDQI